MLAWYLNGPMNVDDAATNLRASLAALVKHCRQLTLERLPAGAELPLLASRFGGLAAYAEAGEAWPRCEKCGKPEAFVCQIDLTEHGPPGFPFVGLLVLFKCWLCLYEAWAEDGPRGFHARVYPAPSASNAVELEPPAGVEATDTYAVVASALRSTVPSWNVAPEAIVALATSLEPSAPYTAFAAACREADAIGAYATYVGGHPGWFDADETPRCPTCETPECQILQFYAEHVDLLWEMGAGSFFLFACARHPADVHLRYQCE
jgi:hypothetical protein